MRARTDKFAKSYTRPEIASLKSQRAEKKQASNIHCNKSN
jgi:hypothetical protein